ncbi:MAG: hypothetical protein RL258_904, partial [Pseudomonadota bacterium]
QQSQQGKAAGSGNAKAQDKPAAPPAGQARPQIEFGSDSDYQLRQALNHLQGLPVATSPAPPVVQ